MVGHRKRFFFATPLHGVGDGGNTKAFQAFPRHRPVGKISLTNIEIVQSTK